MSSIPGISQPSNSIIAQSHATDSESHVQGGGKVLYGEPGAAPQHMARGAGGTVRERQNSASESMSNSVPDDILDLVNGWMRDQAREQHNHEKNPRRIQQTHTNTSQPKELPNWTKQAKTPNSGSTDSSKGQPRRPASEVTTRQRSGAVSENPDHVPSQAENVLSDQSLLDEAVEEALKEMEGSWPDNR
jgi:hypothetical protein